MPHSPVNAPTRRLTTERPRYKGRFLPPKRRAQSSRNLASATLNARGHRPYSPVTWRRCAASSKRCSPVPTSTSKRPPRPRSRSPGCTGGGIDLVVVDLQIGAMGGMAITMELRNLESYGGADPVRGADAARSSARRLPRAPGRRRRLRRQAARPPALAQRGARTACAARATRMSRCDRPPCASAARRINE